MQRSQAQVTRFGECNGMVHSFPGTNLTNQNHIRGLAQGVLQRSFETFRIQSYFTLSDDTPLMVMNIFNWIFDTDDMAGAVLVAITDHRRQ